MDSSPPSSEPPEDDWKTRWALYFFLGVLALSFLYLLIMLFSM